MKSNKIDALLYQLESGKMECDKSKILFLIRHNLMTLDNIVHSGWKIQTASARLSDLEQMGLVVKIYNPDGKYSFYKFIENKEEQEKLRNEIARNKVLKYFARGCELDFLIFNDENDTWEFNMSKITF